MENKKIIWSFFDSETATVSKAVELARLPFIVYSFGLGDGLNHIDLDFSEIDRLKKKLDKYPKPDYIFASPPCSTFSIANYGSVRFYTDEKVLNLYYKDKWRKNDFLSCEQRERVINGECCASSVAMLISHYKPQFWAVENPTRSYLFDFLFQVENLNGYRNLTNYFSYGFSYFKLTTIYSNCLLSLKNGSYKKCLHRVKTTLEKHIPGLTHREISILRSRVPSGLYIDIIKQFDMGGQKPIFDFVKHSCFEGSLC
jgi:hypothetical protein